MKILNMNAKDFPEKLREAIGAEPGDTINITTPQFARPSDMPPPPCLPASEEQWRRLKFMSVIEAEERGFGNWEDNMFLLPCEWYAHIPPWLEVECINGEVGLWGDKQRDNDIRFGCLAYGIRINQLGGGGDE